MNSSLTISRDLPAVFSKKLHPIVSEEIKAGLLTSIPLAKEAPVVPHTASETRKWVMPPLIHSYFKGRDNDPL